MAAYFDRPDARVDLIAEFGDWLGTPFAHRQAVKGVGVDCVQLIGQIMTACGVVSSYQFGSEYTLDWSHHHDRSIILDYIARTGRFVRVPEPMLGDVVCFTIGKCVHHAGVMASSRSFLHAMAGSQVKFSSLRDRTWAKRTDSFWRAVA
jgi:cell wall-associated NlpC family hydrolase